MSELTHIQADRRVVHTRSAVQLKFKFLPVRLLMEEEE